ncbi:MAG: ABC transporter permease subunit [Anaerolineae bacterium]|nr:ABC transporter permease subunit [Anaerolineae bacterium]MDQ7033488.1 ABC transporter permease subunit [Anaerolineae bacterium]
MDFANVWTIAQKEVRDALRNRWFVLFTIAFAVLALALSLLSQPSGTQLRLASYGRTAAGLINLVLLFVPLIALTLGASGLASDRETGALAYLLAQPVNHSEVLFGKYIGMATALLSSLALGFGIAGIALIQQGTTANALGYLVTVGLACLLALSMLSVGFLIAVLVHKTSTALTSSLFAWLFLVFIGDLGIMGAAIITQMPIATIFWIATLNPLQMFKMAAILNIQANLEVLGPAGLYATETYGTALMPMLLLGLLLWVIVPLALAQFTFSTRSFITAKRSLA